MSSEYTVCSIYMAIHTQVLVLQHMETTQWFVELSKMLGLDARLC